MDYVEVMQRVSSGEYDLTVADSLFLKSYLPYHQDLISEFSLTSNLSMAWAIPALKVQLIGRRASQPTVPWGKNASCIWN